MIDALTREAVNIGPLALPGELVRVPAMAGLVLFASGGTDEQTVAKELQQHHLGTLLFDLFTDAEAADARNVFDIALLAERVGQALDWTQRAAGLARQPFALFGAGTGAAAALVLATVQPGRVAAVVSSGGRPDLAAQCLAHVQAPTLLIVGELDRAVLAFNRAALRALRCEKRLEVIPGATDLFEGPGALDCVAELAGQWLEDHLSPRRFA